MTKKPESNEYEYQKNEENYLILKFLLVMPITYVMIIPGVILHLSISIYHLFVFKILGIPYVDSKDFFVYDRQFLKKLNFFERINCYYCSYYNNLFSFCSEIAARTERFWCPIKYEHSLIHKHSQYLKFLSSKDGKKFREKWEKLRRFSEIS